MSSMKKEMMQVPLWRVLLVVGLFMAGNFIAPNQTWQEIASDALLMLALWQWTKL